MYEFKSTRLYTYLPVYYKMYPTDLFFVFVFDDNRHYYYSYCYYSSAALVFFIIIDTQSRVESLPIGEWFIVISIKRRRRSLPALVTCSRREYCIDAIVMTNFIIFTNYFLQSLTI